MTADRRRRVLLKLSGEAFGGGSLGVNPDVVSAIAREIAEAATDVEVAIVVGGGNFFRGAELSQRGMDRGEFRPVDMQYGVYVVLAPMMFLVMWKHSLGACLPAQTRIDPQTYLQFQIDTILRGLALPPTPDTGPKGHS